MSNLVYPNDLPGLRVDMRRAPEYSTAIETGESGLEHRASWWNQTRVTWQLQYEVLRIATTTPDWQRLVGFHDRHSGRWDSFLFQDPEDYVVPVGSPQPFGFGDGVTTEFRLQRSLTDPAQWSSPPALWPSTLNGFEPIGALSMEGDGEVELLTEADVDIETEDGFQILVAGFFPSLRVYADGVELSQGIDYTVALDGSITMLVAPASGVALTWTGEYYWRARFADDMTASQRIVPALWEARTVDLIKVLL